MVSKDEQKGVPTLHPLHYRKPSNHTLDAVTVIICCTAHCVCVHICDSTCCWPWGFIQSVPTNLTFLCSGNCCCSVCSFARSTFDATHPWGMSTPHAVLYACYICSHAVLYACYICPHAVLYVCMLYMSTCSVIRMHVIYVHMQCYTYACYICPHAVLYVCMLYMSTCSVIRMHVVRMSTCSVICMLYVHIQCYMSASSVIYTPVCLLYCEPQSLDSQTSSPSWTVCNVHTGSFHP
jgi:hypothetical protein